MITFHSGQISKKEETKISGLLCELIDIYSDFYITRDNIRLYLKENQELLFDSLKKGNKIAYHEEYGIAIVDGYADNAKRKYVKILAKDVKSAFKLLRVINSNIKDTLYAKIKKKNPILQSFKNNYFEFKGSRGMEILLIREVKYGNNVSRTKNKN